MAANETLRVLIKMLLEGGQLPAAAAKELDKLGESSKRAQSQLKATSLSLGQLGAAVGVSFGSAQVIRFLADAYVGAARTERQFGALVGQIRSLGQESRLSEGDLRALIDRLSRQYGILDDNLVPAMSRLVLGLGDVDQAQRALEISARFAANGFGTVESNAEALANAIQSGAVRSLKQFGVQTEDANGKAITLADGIEQLGRKYETLPKKIDDAQSRLDHFNRAVDNLRDTTGDALDAIFKGLEKLKDLGALSPILQGLTAQEAPEEVKPKEAAEDPLLAAAKAKQAAEEKAAADKKTADAVEAQKKREADLDDKLAVYLHDNQEERRADIQKTIDATNQGVVDAMARQAEADEKGTASAKARNEKIAQEELDVRSRALEASLELVSDKIDQQRELEEQALAEKHMREMEAARILGQDLGNLEGAQGLEVLALKRRFAKAEEQIEKEKARAKQEAMFTLAKLTVELLGTIFGENKAVAIAAAFVNTAEGVTKALASLPPPFSFAAAAITGAIGAAQIAKIMSTNPGGGGGAGGGDITAGRGFDDPVNDRLAFVGGQRWASDMLRNITGGMSKTIQAATASPSAATALLRPEDLAALGSTIAGAVPQAGGGAGTVVHVTIHGMYGGTAGLRRLKRELQRATQLDSLRTVS